MRINSFGPSMVRGLAATLLIVSGVLSTFLPEADAGLRLWSRCHPISPDKSACSPGNVGVEGEGSWYWMRSPDEERRVVASLYTRYCMRCHGNDGRGVWDMPGVPNFTDARWQASRSEGQVTRIIIEGRGAVMPPFRGTLSLEEASAMSRYLRTFAVSSELPRPKDTK
jgi:hypothetical protein